MTIDCPPISRKGVLGFVFLCLLLSHTTDALAGFYLFRSSEEQSRDLSAFPKWTKTISRDETSRIRGSKCAAPCPKKKWDALITNLRGINNKKEQLKQTQKRLNKHPYIKDIVNWGVKDYWATPFQFLRVDGDCEDYAIAKYMALKSMGWDIDDMRIVVLNDNNLNILHSVLAVDLGGEIYILDNQIDQVISHTKIHHYRPIYSINEHAWWRHTQ